MVENIRVTFAPHISKHHSTRSIMIDVVIGLVPAMAAAGLFFRQYALILLATCITSCVATEWICNLIRKKPNSLGDFSAVVTGIILALSLPPAMPYWAAIIGSVFCIAIGKMVFGGLGANIFNPAMVGRTFLAVSFGALMTTWTVPATSLGDMPEISAEQTASITQATPLSWSKDAIKASKKGLDGKLLKYAYLDGIAPSSRLLTGDISGCLGETSALALLIGGLYLVVRKTINVHIPLAVILSAVVFSGIAYLIDSSVYMSPLNHVAAGGFLLCTFFIATDPVTAPLSTKGMWIFGVLVGVLTMLIRIVGEYPEGVMFAILLANAATPLIDRFCKLTPAGGIPNA